MNQPPIQKQLAAALRSRGHEIPARRIVAGFDGFVDEFIQVVATRHNLTDYSAVADISTFADLIKAASGRSSLREIVLTHDAPGGCAINLSDGLAALGIPLDVFATLGDPIHPAFEPIIRRFSSVRTWGTAHGRTLAFEFADGKLMFSAVSQLAEFTPQLLDEALADGAYRQACGRADLIALTNWSLYPHMTACWRKLLREVYSKLGHKPAFYFDLVDPSSRSEEDIALMLSVLAEFQLYGRAILGLNGNEARILGRVLKVEPPPAGCGAPEELGHYARLIRHRLGISQVVVHHHRGAALAEADQLHTQTGFFTASPMKSTGAGDRFNSGFCLGLLLDLPPRQRILLAHAASGFFVRNARSATLGELIEFLEGNEPDA